MRILQVIASVEEEASGPSYSVVRLSESLAQLTDEVQLLTVGDAGERLLGKMRHSEYPRSFAHTPLLSRFCFSSRLRAAIMREAARMDIIHSHGVWLMPNLYPAWASSRYRRPHVVSPRGMLTPVALRFSRRAKQMLWALVQGPAVRNAACLHATSELEFRELRDFGLRQPIAIIPNGIDLPAERPAVQSNDRTLLFLGRIHPKKGIENLLLAWRQVAPAFPDWRLKIVGRDEDEHQARLEGLVADLSIPRVAFVGARYGKEKQAEYQAAELFILPSHSENFGMTVAEALSHGVPVITTTGTPWAKVVDTGCGWWVTPNAEGLEAALRDALTRDAPALRTMGRAGRAWMERDFSWPRLAGDFEATYRWILGGGAPPDFVRCD